MKLDLPISEHNSRSPHIFNRLYQGQPPCPRGSKPLQSSPEFALEFKGLEKIYGAVGRSQQKHALKGIDLTVPRGSIFGLLGPNGAGKSTMINILVGLVKKTSGTAKVWGFDIDEDLRQARADAIGIVPQELNIDPFFSPRELLDLQAGLYGVPKVERRTRKFLNWSIWATKQTPIPARFPAVCGGVSWWPRRWFTTRLSL